MRGIIIAAVSVLISSAAYAAGLETERAQSSSRFREQLVSAEPGSSFTEQVSLVSPACETVKSRNPRPPLSREDSEIIRTYIFQGPILNFYLRARSDPANASVAQALFKANNLTEQQVITVINKLDKILIRQANVTAPITVFRGEGHPYDWAPRAKSLLHYDNYISTTRDRNLALGYATQDKSVQAVLYEINIYPGQLGVQINELAPKGARSQDEFLLARNGNLIVNKITKTSGLTVIKAFYR